MSTEIQQRASFSHVRYAMCWEDADILVQALRCHEGRHCLSIGSAGDNSFALLAAGAASVTVAEMNPAQVACIELRRAAYLTLEHGEFLELLGIRPCGNRRALLDRIAPELPEAAWTYWHRQPELIDRGPAHVGKFERYFHLFRGLVLPLAHPAARVEALLQPRSAAEREAFYDRTWNNRRWRLIFAAFFSRFTMGRLGRDPEFFKYVEGFVADRILARVRHALVTLDPSQNPYLHYILTGNFRGVLPLALRPEHYDAIRTALRDPARFRVHEGTIESALAAEPGRKWDAFNLSDIFEYMSEANTATLLQALAAAATPGARLAYWNMLAPRSRPEGLASVLEPQLEESARLFHEDKAFFYSKFVVEEVVS